MEILNLGGSFEPSEKSSKKKFKVVLGIGLLAGVMGLGSTLAASVTLNSGTTVEFGQGMAATTACDSAITITPSSTFVNDSTSATTGDFQLRSISITNLNSDAVNTGTGVGCGTRVLILKAYTNSTGGMAYAVGGLVTNPLYLGWYYSGVGVSGGNLGAGFKGYNSGIAITVGTAGGSCSVSATGYVTATKPDVGGATCVESGASTDATTIVVTLGGSTSNSGTSAIYGVSASAVSKITLESGSAVPSGYTQETGA